MGYTGHDLSAEKFKEYLLRTVQSRPDDQRVVEGPCGLMGFGRLAIMGLTPEDPARFYRGADCVVMQRRAVRPSGSKKKRSLKAASGCKFCSDWATARSLLAAVLRVRAGYVPPHGRGVCA
ncbi:MAG: hypothetical protein ACLVJH_08195 [Faecalibacterium prausnitzii]